MDIPENKPKIQPLDPKNLPPELIPFTGTVNAELRELYQRLYVVTQVLKDHESRLGSS